MDIKKWFEDGTGMKIKELRYIKMPDLPYNIYIDDQTIRGSDKKNNIIEHNITFEHYSEKIEEKKIQKIQNFLNLNEIEYEKNTEWLEEEELFVTVFELEPIFEKIRKENNNEK